MQGITIDQWHQACTDYPGFPRRKECFCNNKCAAHTDPYRRDICKDCYCVGCKLCHPAYVKSA